MNPNISTTTTPSNKDATSITKAMVTRRPLVTLSKSLYFSSSHLLTNPLLTSSENLEIYGKCNQLHGHNYCLKVSLKSTLTSNGFVIDAKILKEIMLKAIKDLDHSHLNLILETPTCENLTVFVYGRIYEDLTKFNLKSLKVEIQETESISCCFEGEFC